MQQAQHCTRIMVLRPHNKKVLTQQHRYVFAVGTECLLLYAWCCGLNRKQGEQKKVKAKKIDEKEAAKHPALYCIRFFPVNIDRQCANRWAATACSPLSCGKTTFRFVLKGRGQNVTGLFRQGQKIQTKQKGNEWKPRLSFNPTNSTNTTL